MKRARRLGLFLMFLLLPITINYFSPYLIIDGLANKVISGSFVIWALMFISSLVIGRAFCSYICPYGGLQMSIDSAIQKPLKASKLLKKIKYIIGILWLTPIIVITIINIKFLKLDFFYLTENFVSSDNIFKLIFYYFIVIALSILPIFLGKRATCHYLCPMSILNITGTKIKNIINMPSLRLRAYEDNCVGCKQCNRACPMSLDVSKMVNEKKMNSTECILCGECSNACKYGAVKRVFGMEERRKVLVRNNSSKRFRD